eukprot:1196316-Prorocentrum_minimum.AAC.4
MAAMGRSRRPRGARCGRFSPGWGAWTDRPCKGSSARTASVPPATPGARTGGVCRAGGRDGTVWSDI